MLPGFISPAPNFFVCEIILSTSFIFLNRLQGRSEIKVRVQSLMFNYKFTVDLTSKWYQNLLGKTQYLSDM